MHKNQENSPCFCARWNAWHSTGGVDAEDILCMTHMIISGCQLKHCCDYLQEVLNSSSLFDSKSMRVFLRSLHDWAGLTSWTSFAWSTKMHLHLGQFVLIWAEIKWFSECLSVRLTANPVASKFFQWKSVYFPYTHGGGSWAAYWLGSISLIRSRNPLWHRVAKCRFGVWSRRFVRRRTRVWCLATGFNQIEYETWDGRIGRTRKLGYNKLDRPEQSKGSDPFFPFFILHGA